MTQSRYTKSFTLVELLVVIIVIGILASLLLPAIFGAKVRAQVATASAAITNLSNALKQYETDWGTLPPHTTGSFDSVPLVNYLDGDPATGAGTPRTGYYEFKAEDLVGGRYMDPFGNEYHYRQPFGPGGTPEPTIQNRLSFDLWSEGEFNASVQPPGPDGAGEDDITNWRR